MAILEMWRDGWPGDQDRTLAQLATAFQVLPVPIGDGTLDEETRLDLIDDLVRTWPASMHLGAAQARRLGHNRADREWFIYGLMATGTPVLADHVDIGMTEASITEILGRGLGLDRYAAALQHAGGRVSTLHLVQETVDRAGLLEPVPVF